MTWENKESKIREQLKKAIKERKEWDTPTLLGWATAFGALIVGMFTGNQGLQLSGAFIAISIGIFRIIFLDHGTDVLVKKAAADIVKNKDERKTNFRKII